MDIVALNGKINEFELRLAQQMREWLSGKLPKITDDWWQELVINNLSNIQRTNVYNQNVTEIRGLDLAELLRVAERNWYVITDRYYMPDTVRDQLREMQSIRNDWGHVVPDTITKKKVLNDTQVIIDLMEAFGASSTDTMDMHSFLIDVEDDKEISETKSVSAPVQPVASEPVKTADSELTVGSVVTFISDPDKVGAVIAISGNNYSVLVNGEVKNFFREQIQPQTKANSKYLSLKEVKASLTAYQIRNPGNSNLYSLNAARIDFVPYQFRPALKMIHSDSPRILVADDVGVGKTIEAGLIMKEMEARSELSSVLVICPRPLVAERKWQLEMKRFDENFTQLDGRELQECIQETDRDGEWPERHSKTVIPYSLFNEDSIMGTQSTSSKRKKNLGLSELDPEPHFDLVIVDEAHNIRNANTWMYRGVELFCRNADAVVFLTATPLQNSNNDLYTLLNVLRPDVVVDKDTFVTMSEPNAYVNNLLRIVRNQKDGWQEAGKAEMSNILSTSWGRNVIQHNPDFEAIMDFLDKDEVTREEKVDAITRIQGLHSFNNMINRTRRRDIEDFCIRRTQTVDAPMTDTQRQLYDALMEFDAQVLLRLHGSQNVRFMMCTIMRQAASCIFGLAPFMKDFVRRKMAEIETDGELYDTGDLSFNDDEQKSLNDLASEVQELSKNLTMDDPKFDKMMEVIDKKQKDDNNRVIIFSSFRHTLAYLNKRLKEQGIRVGQVDGSVPDEERYNLRQRFLLDRDDPHAIDVLLFSEVGCEGLDYQFCDTMINYDLPWNPMRIEQRIGRIDRRGQKSDTVQIYNMITDDTIDAVIYDRCLSKIGVFEDSIGDCGEILGDISDQIFKIMFDPDLTDEERTVKIEQMADNEVMKTQEMRKLEQEEKSLYGFDLSRYVIDKDVQDAENPWISSQSMNQMLNEFMDDFLGPGEYLRGKTPGKMLRLSSDKRQKLLGDIKDMDLPSNNNAAKIWKAYLKSNKPQLAVTFDSQYAKDNRDVTFLTQMHPFVQEAAAYEAKKFPCEVAIRVVDPDITSGEYEFLIYNWDYVGLRPDKKLVAVSDNEAVQSNVLSFLQYATEAVSDEGGHEDKWKEIDDIHYGIWQKAKEEYRAKVENECNFRLDQLNHSSSQQEAIVRDMIDKATDDKIKVMRQSQLQNIINRNQKQQDEINAAIGKADIHTDLLVRGVLYVD